MSEDNSNPEGENDWTENELVKKDIERSELSDEAKVEKILDLVKSPIEFSLRDIKFIEENKDLVKYNKDFRYGFRKISEYYLSLSVVKGSIMPSRILYALGTSSLLRDFVPPKIKQGIELVIDTNLKEIDELSNKSIEAWSIGQTSQALSLYKSLKEQNKKSGNKKINEVFKKISKSLVGKAIELANNNETLTTTQRLIIWEIRKQIPKAFRTSDEVGDVLNTKSQEESEVLLRSILDTEKNNSDLVLVWDILEDLAYQHDVSVSLDDKKKLRNFILRGNATHFLEAIKNSENKVLLPIHLQALKQLESENFQELWKATDDQFQLKISKAEKKQVAEKKYEKKKAKLEKKETELKEKAIEEILKNDKLSEEDKTEYISTKEEFENLLNSKIGDKTLKEIAEQIKRIFNISEKRQKISDSYFNEQAIDTLSYKESSVMEKYEALKHLKEGLVAMKKRGFDSLIPSRNNEENKEEENQKTEALTEEEQNQLNTIFDNLNSSILIKQAEKLNTKSIKTEGKLHQYILADDQNELTKLEKEKALLKSEQVEKETQEEKEDEIFNVYKDPEKVRKEIRDEYEGKLNNRLKTHKLHAADFQVLLDDESRPSGFEDEHAQFYELRNKFKKTLDEADIELSGIETAISKINLEDPNLDELTPYFTEIEKQIGISFFREKLAEDLDSFLDPQIKDEMLKGLIGHYQQEIDEKIRQSIGELAPDHDAYRNQQEFFLNQIRTHTNINTTSEIRQLDTAYLQYFDKKTNIDKDSEIERNKLEGVLEGLDESDKEKIRSTYNYANNYLKNGYENDDFQFPGTNILNQAALESKPIALEFDHFIQKYNNKFDDLAKDVLQKDDFDLSFKNFNKSWTTEGRIELKNKIDSFKNLCENVIFTQKDENGDPLYAKFLNNYFKTIDTAVLNIEKTISNLNETVSSSHKFTGKEQIWTKLQSDFANLKSWISFDEGELKKHEQIIRNRLFNHQEKNDKNENIDVDGFAETVQELKDIGVFDDRVSAQKEFDEMRMDFNEKAKAFDDSSRTVKLKIELDQKRLNDEKFEKKYGMSKNEATLTLDRFGSYKNDFDEQWNKFDKKDYFDIWWEKYQKGDKERFEAIREFQDIKKLTESVEEMSNKADDLNKWLEDWENYGELERQNRWYNRITTQSFSLYSIYLLIKQNMEIVDTNFKRKQDRMAYNVGQQIYGDSLWGKEFRRLAEDSENERVKQWEGNYASLEVWNVAEELYKTNDPDEAKACINILNEKGYLKWDNPRLWRTLMRLQSNVVFNIPEDMSLEPRDLVAKVGNACELIWTKEDFKGWDMSMDDNLSKAKSGHEKEFRNLTDSKDSEGNPMMVVELSNMLSKWSKGDTTDVYPDKYFSFLNMAFEQGKVNGQPDKRWYFLIKGVTTKNPQGESLLSKTVFNKFYNDLVGNMPYFEFFIDKSSWKKDGRIVPPNTEGAKQRIWNYHDFECWGDMFGDNGGTFYPNDFILDKTAEFFYEIIDMSSEARSRVERTIRGANTNIDHDDGETFFTGFGFKDVLTLLSSKSEGTQQVTDDTWRNWLKGFDRYMERRKIFINKNDLLYGIDDPNWKKMRKEILLDVGDRLKTASAVVQVLSGNFDSKTQKQLIWSETEWKDEHTLAATKAEKHKNTINNFLFSVLDEVGDKDVSEYKENLTKDFYKKSTDADFVEKLPGWEETNAKNQEFFSDSGGGSKYFTNTTAVWNVLKNYGEGNNGLSMAM